ncbi:MAG TPA: hypothetical protein P5330_06240 [Candidatus Competibacteraceae bacterium]|nr:hypothetical protein [Candidatus Competibacteraceae bacterium]
MKKTATLWFAAALLALSASIASAGLYDYEGRNTYRNLPDNQYHNIPCNGYGSDCW